MKTAYFLTTSFGIGRVPVAPGTFGSLPAVAVYIALQYAAPGATIWALAALAAVFSWICVKYGPAVVADCGRKDPGFVVADEVAGQSLTLIGVTLVGVESIWISAALGFVLFRLFDVFKPFPCKQLEKFPGGIGILADDLMAGVYGAIAAAIFGFLKARHSLDNLNAVEVAVINPFFSMILGITQGLTEFLPVSSSGHLVLLEHFLPVPDPDSDEMLLFDLSLHVATVGSIAIVFGRRFVGFIKGFVSIGKYNTLDPIRLYRLSPAVRFAVLAGVTTLTTALCYGLWEEPLESARKLWVLAPAWAFTASILLVTDLRRRSRRGLRDIGIWFAVILGVVQSVAILPGISRSGATICVAILLGLHRRWAVEYSFLISIPAILGGTVLQIVEQPDILSRGVLPIGSMLAGMAAALVAGVLALKWLIRASRKRKLSVFALYCLLLSVFVLFYII
jgi:undecaprenyl-diphosphatase